MNEARVNRIGEGNLIIFQRHFDAEVWIQRQQLSCFAGESQRFG